MTEDRVKDLYLNYFKQSEEYTKAEEIQELRDNMYIVWGMTSKLNVDAAAIIDLEDAISDAISASEMQGFIYAWKFFAQFGIQIGGVCS